jgi:hypothetical protein
MLVPGLRALSMSKNILIPESLFRDVFMLLYYLVDEPLPDMLKALCMSIEEQLSDKVKKMQLHKAFSDYKSAPPGAIREKLRLEYVRLLELHKDFISKREIPFPFL